MNTVDDVSVNEASVGASAGAFAAAAVREVRAAIETVAEAIGEVRAEVADRLREADAKTFLNDLQEHISKLLADTDLASLANTAIRGLEAARAWCEGERDLSLFDAIVDIVAFATQVQYYVERGHFVGDLKQAAQRLLPAILHIMPLIGNASKEQVA